MGKLPIWRPTRRNKTQPQLMLVLRPFELEGHMDCGPHLSSRQIKHEWTRGPGIHLIERSLPDGLRQAHCLKRSRAPFRFSISRMTNIKTSTCYFACASPVTTAASFSSIWFQPSNCPLFFVLSMGSFPMKVSFVWPFPRSSKMVTS
jgi:hypothetical protein